MHNLFEGRSSIILRGRREKGMHQSTHDQYIRLRLTKNHIQIQTNCERRNTSAS